MLLELGPHRLTHDRRHVVYCRRGWLGIGCPAPEQGVPPLGEPTAEIDRARAPAGLFDDACDPPDEPRDHVPEHLRVRMVAPDV